MLTFVQAKDHVPVIKIKEGKRKKLTQLYWSPVIKPEYRNAIDDLDYFFKNENFCDRFELNRDQADTIKQALENGNCDCTHLHKKYYKCKKYITESLNQEMDLSDSKMSFVFDFPEGADTYPWSTFVCGSSGSGKTYWVSSLIKQNLDKPEKERRHFLYVSNEFHIDKTLEPLKDDKYRDWFRGIDISEQSVNDTELTEQQYYDQEVKMRIDNAPPGTVVVLDDAPDSPPIIAENIRRMLIKLLRVGRHRKVGVMFLLHKLNSGMWSSQGYSSCKYIVTFPRSGKNRIRKMMEDELGLTKRDSERHLLDFAQTSRAMIIRLHAPNCILNEKLIRLI